MFPDIHLRRLFPVKNGKKNILNPIIGKIVQNTFWITWRR